MQWNLKSTEKKNPSYALGKGVEAIQFVLIVNAI